MMTVFILKNATDEPLGLAVEENLSVSSMDAIGQDITTLFSSEMVACL